MKTLSRRSLMTNAGVALLGATALSGCATAKSGTVTSATLNVAKIMAYATAGVNAGNTINHVIAKIPGLAQFAGPIDIGLKALQIAADAFYTAAGASLTVRYDNASMKTLVDSVLDAIQQILGVVVKMTKLMFSGGLAIPGDLADKIELTYDALATVASVFKVLLIPSLASADAPMTLSAPSTQVAYNEYRALKVLGV